MTQIIDKRLNPKNSGQVNRQRFLQRYRKQIKAAVNGAIKGRSVTDTDKGEVITIDPSDTVEHQFHTGKGGVQTRVLPGNNRYTEGDQIERPDGKQGEQQGAADGSASNAGDGDDLFQFELSRDEFMHFMFDDLELPNLVKRHANGVETHNPVRAGYTNEGTPGRLNIVRSLKSAMMRRMAMSASYRRELATLTGGSYGDDTQDSCDEITKQRIKQLKKKIASVPFIDNFDLKYNLVVDQPKPTSQAVMFCLMDVSGSMTESTKEMAKRFYMLLYLFLQRNYEKIDLIFIRHHTTAKEVDEHNFFYSRETGGTIVSSALKLMADIIDSRYPAEQWNIYGAQASDGDNWNEDSLACVKLLKERILPNCQHFSYVEITSRDHQALWHEYSDLASTMPYKFAIEHVTTHNDVYPVFRNIFQAKHEAV